MDEREPRVDGVDDHAPEESVLVEAGGGSTRPRRRWGRRILLAMVAVGLVLAGLAVALVVSERGQRMVLDFLLERVRGSLAGTLAVDTIRSPSLLRGAVLVGVHLDAEGGRPFLDADSVRLRYSLLGLVGSRRRVSSVTVYGPHIRITRYAGEDALNVTRLLAPREEGDSVVARLAPLITFGRVIVEDGLLEVLTPAGGDLHPRMLTVAAPGGDGRLRRIALEGLALTADDVRVYPGADPVVEAWIEALATEVALLDRPVRVGSAEGLLRFGDDGLRVDSAEVRLPGSALRGSLALGPDDAGSWGFRMDLRTLGPAALADLEWLDDRIPAGVWRGSTRVSAADGIEVDLGDVQVELEGSRFSVDGFVRVADRITLRDLEVRTSPLSLGRLEPWVQVDFPLDGWLSGRMRMSGPLSALATEGRMSLVSTGHAGGPTTAEFRGTLHLGADPGVTDLHALIEPVNYVTLGAFLPAARLSGSGRIEFDAAGRVDDGIRFVADLGHRLDSASVSHVLARGSVRRGAGGRWATDVQGDLSPLSLGMFAGTAPALGLQGDVAGSVRAVGPLDSLRVTGALRLGGGTASVDGTFDALTLADGYRLDARLDRVVASRLARVLPDPTEWTGHLRVEGRGLTLDSLDAHLTLAASGSRVGGLRVDTVTTELTATGGMLRVDTLDANLGGVQLSGSGGVGMVAGATGEVRLSFRTENVEGLRSIFRGDVVTARDSLTSLDLERLRMEGVDVDTLPTRAEVAMSGAMEGDVLLSGSFESLDVTGSAVIREGVYGVERLERAELAIDVRRIGSDDREGHVAATVHELELEGRRFEEVEADMDVLGRGGQGTLLVTRNGTELYDLEASFALDTLGGGEARLTRATFALDSLAWHLTQPSEVVWDSASVTLRGFSLTREGADPMNVTAGGTLAWAGESDLRVEARGLHLDRVAHIAQLDTLRLGGHLDLDVTVTGPAGTPLIDGSFEIEEPRYRDLALGAISGDLTYGDRQARVRVEASDEGRRVFTAEGTVPIDLALDTEGRRVVDRSMDLRVVADSLKASVALSYLDFLRDVEGVVSGDFQIGGTLDRPEPSGVLTLDDAAWSIEAIGVRHTGVGGSLTLNADRTVDVRMATRQPEGNSQVTGRVTLEPLDDPRLDLVIVFDDFIAVDRRDVVGHVSGEVHLGETYRRPLLTGQLTVDHGTLFLDEFVRNAEVVDLSDPRFGLVVDTAALSGRPLLAGINNPFLQNLRVSVDLSVPRDLWLRSADMNVEMGGDLIVSYDRSQRDIVMVGELEALRGQYTVLGRRFEVESGTVGFIGTAGINPSLDIQAVSRVRRAETEPLAVTARVSGTLTQPRVTLSTDEQGVAESDLVSYLIFGRPSYQIATNDAVFGGGAAGAAAGAGVTWAAGTLATRLGSALSEQIGLDYLSISQAGQYGVASGLLGGAFSGTQIEIGQYLAENVFVVLIFRAPSDQTGTQTSPFGGVRVEVEMTDDYNLQAFWEDRFLRSRVGGFGDLDPSKVIGVFIFREWGY